MKERPILFSAPMVRAILEGRKTVTRRVVKPQPVPCDHSAFDRRAGRPVPTEFFNIGTNQWACRTCGEGVEPDRSPDGCSGIKCPYGQPGDRLWVRETHRPAVSHSCAMDACDCADVNVEYRADGEIRYFSDYTINDASSDWCLPRAAQRGKFVPAIHMPRWASRITLEVTGVRVERLHDITETGAIGEGIRELPLQERQPGAWWCADPLGNTTLHCRSPRAAFARLWESINGTDSWNANPWVWVVEFKRVLP